MTQHSDSCVAQTPNPSASSQARKMIGFLYVLLNQRLRRLVQPHQSIHCLHTQNMEADKALFQPVATFFVCSSHLINILR